MGYLAGFWLVAGLLLWMGVFAGLAGSFRASTIDIGIGAISTTAILLVGVLIRMKAYG